jgi:hypothetical protein
MPQLNKCGKYVFGWSLVRPNGDIMLPDEALHEYRVSAGSNVILISGSATSRGFRVSTLELLEKSFYSQIFEEHPELAKPITTGNRLVFRKNEAFTCVRLSDDRLINLVPQVMERFDLKYGSRLLSIRGSNIGFAMIVKGPLVTRALSHSELTVY